jgi:hypothetical protein
MRALTRNMYSNFIGLMSKYRDRKGQKNVSRREIGIQFSTSPRRYHRAQLHMIQNNRFQSNPAQPINFINDRSLWGNQHGAKRSDEISISFRLLTHWWHNNGLASSNLIGGFMITMNNRLFVYSLIASLLTAAINLPLSLSYQGAEIAMCSVHFIRIESSD